jgi:hypothetical protein
MLITRARWCEAIVVLSEIIRSSAGSSANARISNLSNLAAAAAKFMATGPDEGGKDEEEYADDRISEDENEVSNADDYDIIVAERKVKLAAKFGIEPKYSTKEANEVIDVIYQ